MKESFIRSSVARVRTELPEPPTIWDAPIDLPPPDLTPAPEVAEALRARAREIGELVEDACRRGLTVEDLVVDVGPVLVVRPRTEAAREMPLIMSFARRAPRGHFWLNLPDRVIAAQARAHRQGVN